LAMENPVQVPHLKHLDEFRQLLENYRPSDESIKTLRQTRVVLLNGATASGKNTLIQELLKTGQYYNLISDTTRPPRIHNGKIEKNGEFYWHITEEKFLEGLKSGKYLEAAIIHNQQVSGTSISEIKKSYESNKIAISDIEYKGVDILHGFHPGAHCIFILPPAFDTWMERLKARGVIAEEEMRRRLDSARQEISAALSKDYYIFITSGDLESNTQTVHDIAHGTSKSIPDQKQMCDHAEQLIIDVQLFLKS
jgi:guanylate kinase